MSEAHTVFPYDDLSVPNCPRCLEPMRPVVGAWWCAACELACRPGDTGHETGSGPHHTSGHADDGS